MIKHVQLNHPVDLKQAISLATEYEIFSATYKEKPRKPHHTNGSVNVVSGSENQKSNWQNNKQSKQDKNSDESQTKQNGTGSPETKMECRYCKKTNHVIEDCLKLKWKKQQEAKMRQNASESTANSNSSPSGN